MWTCLEVFAYLENNTVLALLTRAFKHIYDALVKPEYDVHIWIHQDSSEKSADKTNL